MGRSTAVAGFTDESGACLFELLFDETRTWRWGLPHRYWDHDKDCRQSKSERMLTQNVGYHVRVLCTRLRAARYESLANELLEEYRIIEHFANLIVYYGNRDPSLLDDLNWPAKFSASVNETTTWAYTDFVRGVERIRDALIAASGSSISADNGSKTAPDAKPVELITLHQATDLLGRTAHVTRSVSDGPCGVSGFRDRGVEKDGMRPKVFLLVRCLWQRDDRTADFDDLKEPVYGDHAADVDGNSVGSLRRDANEFFKRHDFPFAVTLSDRTRRVSLVDKARQ